MTTHGILWRLLALVHRTLTAFGLNLSTTLRAVRGGVPYLKDYFAYVSASGKDDGPIKLSTPFPCLADRYCQSGTASGAYFHQDLLVARNIFESSPVRHIDIGSSVAGFVAHVASFRKIEVLDVRPLSSDVDNILFRQMDLMSELDAGFAECTDSLSCLHALEHFGLGRYGDPICPDGYVRGWNNLHRMLKAGGTLYFSVPIGPSRVEFNAHRVFSLDVLAGLIFGKYKVECFSYVDDSGALHADQPLDDPLAHNNFGCYFGCGIFKLIKLSEILAEKNEKGDG